MEVSNEIKEDIRKTQTELKNAIRIHQVWVARLHEDENNLQIKCKVQEAEKEILVISQSQKRVLDCLRRELELYQQRLRARNRHVNIENDNRYVAKQLRDHQIQYYHRNKSVDLIKQSVLTEIKTENTNGDTNDAEYNPEREYERYSITIERENSSQSNSDVEDSQNSVKKPNNVSESRTNFRNVLEKAKDAARCPQPPSPQESHTSEPGSPEGTEQSPLSQSPSPSPPPPPLPENLNDITQEMFLRVVGLVTPQQKELLEKKRKERRKRTTTSTNKKDFLYENYESGMKRKKLNHFPYLQTHTEPPQTRSAKLKKQQKPEKENKSSREGSPSGSSSEAKERDRELPDKDRNIPEKDREIPDKDRQWSNDVPERDGDKVKWGKPAWAAALPPGLSVEPIYSKDKKTCYVCHKDDALPLLSRCPCGISIHITCANKCTRCRRHLQHPIGYRLLYTDRLAERKRLHERNMQLCYELRKLEARAATLKENLDEHQAEKRKLLTDQIRTQRNLQKLLDFIGQFKDGSLSLHSTSISECSSEMKSIDE